jgi:hypothetical protein
MAEHGGEHFVRIARINGQRRNLLSVDQAEMRPGFAGVGRFINAVAHREVGAMQSLAAAHINNVWVGRRDRDGADRLRGLVVEDRVPGAAVVVRFPNAAVHLADVEHIGLAGHARQPRACARRETGRSSASAIPGKCSREPASSPRLGIEKKTEKLRRSRRDERPQWHEIVSSFPPPTANGKTARINHRRSARSIWFQCGVLRS